jgi:hypothetical protein
MVKLSLLSCSQEILSHEDTCLICSQIYETRCVHCLEMHIMSFKICKSVHHHTIQINQPTRCNRFSGLLLDVYLQLNKIRTSSRPSSGAQQLQSQPLILPSERGGSSAVGCGRDGRPAGPTTTNSTAVTTLRR